MAAFARAKAVCPGDVLKLPAGLPRHDTFPRRFRRRGPVAFAAGFQRFAAACGAEASGLTHTETACTGAAMNADQAESLGAAGGKNAVALAW